MQYSLQRLQQHTVSPLLASCYIPYADNHFQVADENLVIHEWACEPNCAPDGTQFKGIYARNLLALHKVKPMPLFRGVLLASANSIWDNDRNASNQISVSWQGPFEYPANASTQSSALDALIAATQLKAEM